MSGNKWQTNWLKKIIPPGIWNKFKETLSFRPNDPNDLLQILPQRVTSGAVERIKGFRYPAPGSRGEVKIPIRDHEDDIYDVVQYPRDPRNLPVDVETLINSPTPNLARIAPVQVMNKHPGRLVPQVDDYDKTGLRTTYTAGRKKELEVLALKAAPNHLPLSDWYSEIDEIHADCDKKGIPYTLGRRSKITGTSNYNEVKW